MKPPPLVILWVVLHYPDMEPYPRRKFTLCDALILIAAIAIGLVWMRYYQHTEAAGESYPYKDESKFGSPPAPIFRIPSWYHIRVAAWWVVCFYHVVAPVTLAVLIVRLRTPWPRLRRLTRQPGTVGCTVVVMAALIELIWQIPDALASLLAAGLRWSEFGSLAYWDVDEFRPGLAIAAVWLLLAVSGRWRRELDWIDGTGIALSWFWLVVPTAIGVINRWL